MKQKKTPTYLYFPIHVVVAFTISAPRSIHSRCQGLYLNCSYQYSRGILDGSIDVSIISKVFSKDSWGNSKKLETIKNKINKSQSDQVIYL